MVSADVRHQHGVGDAGDDVGHREGRARDQDQDRAEQGPDGPGQQDRRRQQDRGLDDLVPDQCGAAAQRRDGGCALRTRSRARRGRTGGSARRATGDSTTVRLRSPTSDRRDQERAQQRPPASQGQAVGAPYADLGVAVDLAERVGGGRQNQQDARPEQEEGHQHSQGDPEAAALAAAETPATSGPPGSGSAARPRRGRPGR